MVFFGLASVNDLQPVGKGSKISFLCLCKDLLFSVFVFPVGMVSVTFGNLLTCCCIRTELSWTMNYYYYYFFYFLHNCFRCNDLI